MDLLVATGNKHKLQEIKKILNGFEVIGYPINVNENGKTFEENALKKAKAVFKKFRKLTIADDSGLMVNCLHGKPGIKSARFASPPTSANLCKKLLLKMNGHKNRKAKFVCAIAIVFPNQKVKIIKGIIYGKITDTMLGKHGFGYDPIFMPKGFNKTFAEMKSVQKNKISHRSLALNKVKKLLNSTDKTNIL